MNDSLGVENGDFSNSINYSIIMCITLHVFWKDKLSSSTIGYFEIPFLQKKSRRIFLMLSVWLFIFKVELV